MRRVLFDQNVPAGLRRVLPHDISTAYRMGWSTLENGKLLAAAEEAGFAVMVTCDQNMRHQQNLAALRLGIVVLSTDKLPALRDHAALIAGAIDRVGQGACESVRIPRPQRPRRSPMPSP